jgi:large subunit ribosomal protein L29
MSKVKEIRELEVPQLEELIADFNKDIYELNNKLAVTRKLEKPHLLRDKKKDRARAIFVLSEKKNKKDEK